MLFTEMLSIARICVVLLIQFGSNQGIRDRGVFFGLVVGVSHPVLEVVQGGGVSDVID